MENLKRKESIVSIFEETINVNNKIVGTIFKKEVSEEVTFQTKEHFFSNGMLFKSHEIETNTNQKTIREFSNGKLLNETTLDRYGCVLYKIIRKYDVNGNEILLDMDFPGSNKYVIEYLNYYDNQSRIIKRESYRDAKFEYKEDICYDSNNNISLIWRRNIDNHEIYKKNNYYNYSNQLFKAIGIDNENKNSPRFEYLYEYNNNGDVSTYTSSKNGSRQILQYDYKYDYYSNWIEKKQTQDGKINRIFKRKINYR